MSYRIVKAEHCRCAMHVSAFLFHALQYEFPSFDAAVLFLMEFVPANERHLAEITDPDGRAESIEAVARRYGEVTGRSPGLIRARCADCGVRAAAVSQTARAPAAGSAPPAASAW